MDWPPEVLIIAPESCDRDKLQKIFSASGVRVFCYSTLLEAQSFLSGQLASAVFVEDPLPDGDFRSVSEGVQRFQANVPIIALSHRINWDAYLGCMGAGTFDCIGLPAAAPEARRVLWSALHAFSTARRREVVAA